MLSIQGLDAGKQPEGIKPHLVVKLAKGWKYDSAHRVFQSTAGRTLDLKKCLPKRARIVHMTPGLAEADPRSLSVPERNLARYLQIILPLGDNPSLYLATVQSWECVEEARLPPEISLP